MALKWTGVLSRGGERTAPVRRRAHPTDIDPGPFGGTPEAAMVRSRWIDKRSRIRHSRSSNSPRLVDRSAYKARQCGDSHPDIASSLYSGIVLWISVGGETPPPTLNTPLLLAWPAPPPSSTLGLLRSPKPPPTCKNPPFICVRDTLEMCPPTVDSLLVWCQSRSGEM